MKNELVKVSGKEMVLESRLFSAVSLVQEENPLCVVLASNIRACRQVFVNMGNDQETKRGSCD